MQKILIMAKRFVEKSKESTLSLRQTLNRNRRQAGQGDSKLHSDWPVFCIKILAEYRKNSRDDV